jgi:hypothetical protein
VKLRISVDPPDAVVTLDGRVLEGNPYVAVVPRDRTPHALSAVAEGCTEQSQEVRFTSDISLLVALKCQRMGMRLPGKPGAGKPASAAGNTAYPKATAPPFEAPGSGPAASPPQQVSNDNPYR